MQELGFIPLEKPRDLGLDLDSVLVAHTHGFVTLNKHELFQSL